VSQIETLSLRRRYAVKVSFLYPRVGQYVCVLVPVRHGDEYLNISFSQPSMTQIPGSSATDCTIPASIPSINPSAGAISIVQFVSPCMTKPSDGPSSLPNQARADGASVYCIGLASNLNYGECTNATRPSHIISSTVANVQQRPFNPKPPEGEALFTSDPSQLNDLFETIASRILLPITR